MADHHNQSRLSVGFMAGVVAAILATGSLAAWWAFHSIINSPETKQSSVTESPVTQDLAQEERGQVYWLKDTGDRLELLASPVMLQKSVQDQPALQTSLERLLAGPTGSDATTTIPEGTKLLSLKVDKDGTYIYLELSLEFTTGGGSASMTGRLAQLLYTATSLNPKGQVWLSVGGEPLEILGGEGLEIEQPMTRQWFEENFEL